MTEVLLYALGVLILLLGLALSIGLHELGHLLPAKLFGVKVTQYMIGFGKTLWSKRKGETEYGLKVIPLGGYVSMIGMYPPAKAGEQPREASTGFLNNLAQDAREASAETIAEGEEERAFYRLSMWKKIAIMLGGPLMNLVLAFVFFGISLMGFGVAQYTTKVAELAECVLPADSGRENCEAGDPPAPGIAGGMRVGDRVIAIDGVTITSWEQLRDMVSAAPGQQLMMRVERAGSELDLRVVPAAGERLLFDEHGKQLYGADGEPLTETVGMIGAYPAIENVQQPLTAVPAFVFENARQVAEVIVGLPQRMVDIWQAAFGSEDRDPNGPVGVVGVGRIAGEIVSHEEAPVGARAQLVIGLLGSLNVALFVFNLVPLLPLDGGHIVGALYEGTKRRLAKLFGRDDPGPVDTAKMVPVTFAVVIVLGAMSLLLLYADIVKPITLFG